MLKKIFVVFIFILPILVFAADYGSMYLNSTSNQASSWSADTWYQVTGFSAMQNSVFTYTTDDITSPSTGSSTYLVRFSLSFGATAGLYQIGVSINDAAPDLIIERRISNDNDIGNASATGFLTIPSSQTLSIKVKSDNSISSFIPYHCQLIAVDLKQASTPKYGEMNIYRTETSPDPTAQILTSSFTPLNYFSSTESDLSGWTYGSNSLTANTASAGIYLVTLSLSFNGNQVTDYTIGVAVDDNDPTQIQLRRQIGDNTDEGNGVACGIISISDDNTVRAKGKVRTGTKDLVTRFANLILIRLDGNNATPYGSMDSVGNTNTISLIPDTWIQENNFTSAPTDVNYWTFNSSSDDLTPINLSAGKYFVNYYISFGVPSGSSNAQFDSWTSLFVGSTQPQDVIIARTLERKTGGETDIGAESGTGIITIDSPDDVLTLKIDNESNSSTIDVICKYANVNVFRIDTVNGGVLPVTLSTFTASFANETAILQWTTASESNNFGWNVYRSVSHNPGQSLQINLQLIPGAGSTSEPTNYEFTDIGLLDYIEMYNIDPETTFWYWIESIDYGGTTELYGPASLLIPQDEFDPGIPDIPDFIGLYQNYPNPFNPGTEIQFTLASEDDVELVIYNVKGQKIKTLFQGRLPASQEGNPYTFAWDGRDEDQLDVSSGIYFYQLKTTQDEYIRKMVLTK